MRLAEGDVRRMLASARVARLATVTPEGRPHVVPVTFAVDGDRIYTAVDAKPKTTTKLQRLRNVRAHPQAAVLADHYEEDWAALWWARADGDAAIVEDGRLMTRQLELLAARYPQYRDSPPAGPVIAVRVHRWTGWAASSHP